MSVQLDTTNSEYKLLLADIFIEAREIDSAAVVLEKFWQLIQPMLVLIINLLVFMKIADLSRSYKNL
ncbi:MAG: hypothetical protein M5T52_08430 [Ignavibacteriaceae bacterium]|nr:hypothetical protein [Ignavibacteriaceae bacterium]